MCSGSREVYLAFNFNMYKYKPLILYLDYSKKQDLTSLGTKNQNCPGNMTSNVYVTCFFSSVLIS